MDNTYKSSTTHNLSQTSYISSLKENLTDAQIDKLLQEVYEFNNKNDITGLLVFSEGNFFQLIEGEKEMVKDLYYNKIQKDSRHKGIIKFIEKEIFMTSYDGYYVDRVNSRFEIDRAKLRLYINYVKVLKPEVRKPVLKVLESMLPKS